MSRRCNAILSLHTGGKRLSGVTLPKTQIRHKIDPFPIPESFLKLKPQQGRQPKKIRSKERLDPNRALPAYYKNKVVRHDALHPQKFYKSDVRFELNDDVEANVNDRAAAEFGFATRDSVAQLYEDWEQHPDIYPFIPGYLLRSTRDTSLAQIFWHALNGVLPPHPLTKTVTSPKGAFIHRQWSNENLFDAPTGSDSKVLEGAAFPLHWHMLLFNTPINTQELLWDGTDERFLPGPPNIWRYRLWASGSLNLHGTKPPGDATTTLHMTQGASDLRLDGGIDAPQKAWVKVRKRIFQVEGNLKGSDYTPNSVVKLLTADPAWSQDPQTGLLALRTGPQVEEEYTLYFTRDKPDLSKRMRAMTNQPRQSKFEHTLTPNRHLLFCWSAVTYNAHLIHLDPSFARDHYGAPNLLIHGSLTVFLATEWFLRRVTGYAYGRELSRFHLKSINYKNLQPIFVDEEITLNTKPSKFQTPGTLADSWDIWITKKVDKREDQETLVFKATVTLGIEDASKQAKSYAEDDVMDNLESPETPQEKGEAEETQFEDPFFRRQ